MRRVNGMTSVKVEALRRRQREPMSAVEWRVSARYDSAVPIRREHITRTEFSPELSVNVVHGEVELCAQTSLRRTVVRKYPREMSCSNPPLSPQVHALVSTRWYVSANDTHCVFDRVLENMLITVRHHNTCRHNYAVEKGLAVGFFGQLHYCYRPYYPTARF